MLIYPPRDEPCFFLVGLFFSLIPISLAASLYAAISALFYDPDFFSPDDSTFRAFIAKNIVLSSPVDGMLSIRSCLSLSSLVS